LIKAKKAPGDIFTGAFFNGKCRSDPASAGDVFSLAAEYGQAFL
jgi:hypothetical protein